MRKSLLVLAALTAAALIACLFLADDGMFTGGSRRAPDRAEDGSPPAPDATKAGLVREGRARAAEEPKGTLAVVGVVKDAQGAGVAGAVVIAFAVPAGQDVPDEQRLAVLALSKLFGREAAERLYAQSSQLRSSQASFDPEKMRDVMRDNAAAAMDLATDDGGAEAFSVLAMLPRDLAVAGDADWPRAGSAVSLADGTFRVEGLAAGRVELRVKAASYVRAKTRVDAGAANVAVTLTRGARLAGTVTGDKNPVAGATVRIEGEKAETSAAGRFEFDAAHVPDETLFVSAPGFVAQSLPVRRSAGGPNPDVEISLDPAGSVAGHVSAVGGGPVAGARVALASTGNVFVDMMGMGGDAGAHSVPPPPAVTGADGAFEMQGVRIGNVKLRVDAEGYIGATVTVRVKRGETAPCEAMLVRESVLSGTVTDEKGVAVAGAKVKAEVPSRDSALGMFAGMLGGTFRSTLTDDAGRYVVHGLVEGDRKVRVEAKGLLTIEESVEIPPHAPVLRDFRMRDGYRLAGRVATPDGKPAAGAKISVTGSGGSGAGAMFAMFGRRASAPAAESAADGTWTATGLQEGPFEVHASADGWIDAEEKDVAAGRTDVVLTLVQGATLRGRVLGSADMKPVAGARVQRRSADTGGRGGRPRRADPMAAFGGARGPSVECDADGFFEMKSVEPGSYDLVASMKGFADSAPARLSCASAETQDGIEIVLPPAIAVSGRVVERASGAGVEGAVVWAARQESMFGGFSRTDLTDGPPEAPPSSVNSKSDAEGKFVLAGLSPGRVSLEVRVEGHAPVSISGLTAPATDVLVQVSPGGSVEGRVTEADGTPVAEAQVMATRGMMGQGMRRTRTDGSGAFRVERLAPGSWNLMLMDPVNPMMPTTASVVVKDGETTHHDFEKKQGGQQVGGGVSKDGKPLANAPVILMGGGAGMRMAATDDNGRFTFDGLEAGDYTVLVQGSFLGSGAMSRKVTVGSDGKVPDVNLELSSAKVEGDVVDADTGKGVGGAQVVLTAGGAAAGTAEELIGSMRGQTITDDRGHFVINDVAAGTFTLKATAGGWSPATLDGVASGARTVHVEVRRGVEFVVTVTGPDGAPVANATVQTVDASGNSSIVFDMSMSSITRDDGTARLRLAPGRYTLKVTASGLLPAQADADTASGTAAVRLDAGATLDVYVTDGTSAVTGAKVSLSDEAGAEIGRGLTIDGFMGGGDRTGEGGRWSRAGLLAGKVTVSVTDAAGRSSSTETTLELNRTRRLDVVVK
jgi:protocatechuate 3,4-dioxygenase beta subunit